MKDVIQTFDPIRHHGANLPRFRELRQSLPLEQVSNDLFLAHEEPDLCQVGLNSGGTVSCCLLALRRLLVGLL